MNTFSTFWILSAYDWLSLLLLICKKLSFSQLVAQVTRIMLLTVALVAHLRKCSLKMNELALTLLCPAEALEPTLRNTHNALGSQPDPLGFIIPFKSRAKVFIQDIWKQHISGQLGWMSSPGVLTPEVPTDLGTSMSQKLCCIQGVSCLWLWDLRI